MNNKKRLVKLVTSGIIGATLLGVFPHSTFASPGNSEDYSGRMETLESQSSEAEGQLDEILKTIETTESDADELVEEMEVTVEELEIIQEDIAALNKKISQREEQLQSQLRAVQVTGESGNILNFLMEADSLTDILGRLDVVNTLFSANSNLMESQVEDKELVEVKERETVAKQEEQTLVAAKLENKKVELEEKQAEQESLIASISAEQSELEEERERFLAEQRESESRREEIQTARLASEETSVVSTSRSSESSDDSNEVTTSSSNDSNDTVSTPAATGSVVGIAQGLTGSPYVYGGSSPAGFDCSGFTQFVFRNAGKSIPHSASAQYGASTKLSQSQAQPGDLIFFNQSGSVDHVGIYLGGGRFIGAQTSTGVAVASFTSGYWSNHVVGFGRM